MPTPRQISDRASDELRLAKTSRDKALAREKVYRKYPKLKRKTDKE